jgi:hypothetical protein
MTHTASKTCCKCATDKPIEEFCKSSGTKDGFDPRCRSCKNAARNYKKEYEANKRWNDNNRDKRNAINRLAYKRNKSRFQARGARYRTSTRGWIKGKAADLRKRASRGIAVTISEDDIESLITSHCPVLGVTLRYGGPRASNTASLDRIDPTKGYVPGNVVIISDKANRIKSDATLEELRNVVSWLSDQTNYKVRPA